MSEASSPTSKELNLTRECEVCTAPAPDHLHFGGRSCYSCRAFFRRTVQRVKKKGLKRCKEGTNKCQVSQSAKSCIHCRYTKCLEIGMNPELLKGERGVSGGRRRDSRQSSQSSPAPPVAESQVSQGTEGTSYPRPSVIRPVQPLVDQLTQQDGNIRPEDKTDDAPSASPQPRDVLDHTDKIYFIPFSDREDLTAGQVDELLKETLVEIEDMRPRSDVSKLSPAPQEEEREETQTTGHCSVISGLEMALTSEESDLLDHLVRTQVAACKECMPVSLFQARVGNFLGTLKLDEMMAIFSISRKAQNYWHYTTMCMMPGFDELTSRTQSQLIMENMQMCYAITMSYYFFGHNATTAVGQEEQTGILTGLGDFIRGQAPVALSMPPAVYEDYYRSPWATSTQFEDRHKKISTEIGLSFRDVGVLGYIVMYSLTLYNVSDETLHHWNTPDKDIAAIKNVRKFLEIIYVRLLRYKFGWKKATNKMFNQKYILQQMSEVMMINTMENLQLNDFSNSQTINPLTEKRSN